jgi:predicted dehydrogenase
MSKIKVGVIGCGARGSGSHMNAVINTFADSCELIAICDKYQEQLDKAKERFSLNSSVKEYVGETSYIDMLKTESLDLVLIATPWEYHAAMVIECMNNGIRSGCEVPIATTVEECKQIYRTYKKTGIDACIMENVNWREDVMAVLNMKRMGLFGKVNFASGGYMHDLRSSLTNPSRYIDWWRGEHYRNRVGDNYPTHGLGPVQNWLDINKGNRMTRLTSYTNNALGIDDLLKKTDYTINEYYNKEFNTGDMVKTTIQTSNGELIEITLNTTSARPYSLDFSLQGTKGLWDKRLGIFSESKIYLESVTENEDSSNYYTLGDKSCSGTHKWDDGDAYVNRYKHPLYMKYTGKGHYGHGGMDWYMFNSMINSVKNNEKFEISVEDSITMSIIVDISRKSLLQGNKTLEIPDLTDGFWMSNTRFFENCYYINSYDVIPYGSDSYYVIIPDYASHIHEKNNFQLYHYSNSFTEPLQYTYNSTLNVNNTFAVSNLDNTTQYNYLGFNKSTVRDDHYLITSTIEDIKCVEFFFKMDTQIFETQIQGYWCYLLDGRPGNDDTYISIRKDIAIMGNNIEKVILNNEIITENIGQTMFNGLIKNKWNSFKVYFTVPVTDDLSIFSRYNNREEFDGAIANLKIYNSSDAITNSYDFIKYNKDNRFLNSITNTYDLKVKGQYISGIIHDLSSTETLYNSNTDIVTNHNSSDIILFFKKDNIDIKNDKLVIY